MNKAGEYKDWAADKAGNAYDYAKGRALPPATLWQKSRSWATGKPLEQVQVRVLCSHAVWIVVSRTSSMFQQTCN